jgi:hypothetical protein
VTLRRLLALVPILLASYARSALAHPPAPIACELLTLDDVRSVLGATWTASPASFNTNTDKMTTCYYQNGIGNIVALSIVYPPQGDSKTALAKRQKQEGVTHAMVAIPELCDGAITEAYTAQNTTLIAASGEWMVQIQVMVSKKPDVESEKKLAGGICKKMKG